MKSPPKTLPVLPPPLPQHLSPHFSPLSGSALSGRSARFWSLIPAQVVKISSDHYVQAHKISPMITGECDSESDETLRPIRKKKLTRTEHSTTRTQAAASQDSFLLPSALRADVSEKHCFRQKLKAVRRSVLNSYLWPLKMDMGGAKPSSSTDSGSHKLSLVVYFAVIKI